MPRKDFQRDLSRAAVPGKFPYLSFVRSGDHDGSVIFTGSIIVSVSCRVAKLGISEDTMQAWNASPSEYLVLLMRYPLAYVDFKDLLSNVGDVKGSFVQMYVGLSNSYKPKIEDALKIFLGTTTDQQKRDISTKTSGTTENSIRRLFIDKTLNSLLNERFIEIVHHRVKLGLSWTGAELYAHHYQRKSSSSHDDLPDEYFEPDSYRSSASGLLAADHMTQTNCDVSRLSLPLLAIQFTLRHFVKCTEFCLVCHCRIRDNFEAVKPYVCSNSLCLYQYMALGMGPSLEYEICAQPYVVDMLISLTYARAISGRLEDFPTGLGLMVPGGIECVNRDKSGNARDKPQFPAKYHTAKLDSGEMVLHIKGAIPLRVGDWVFIAERETKNGVKFQDHWHCRVQDTNTSHYIKLSDPVFDKQQPSASNLSYPSQCEWQSVKFLIYDTNFDDLTTTNKQDVIPLLLNTLPSIDMMRSFLGNDLNGTPLSAWKDKISPAALDVLRWIVASNRSCIMFDDDDDPEHRVSGMEDYIQFRLVQGAPDKEYHFTNAVKSNALAANPNHPTLFAWHGSPLYNWHSILREGLCFKEIAHGRSYGHGVYLSSKFQTSSGYSGNYVNEAHKWPQSKLNIRAALSLNEVVNAPDKFVCSTSCYVVNQLEWIQPRYLFVLCNISTKAEPGALPSLVYNQDPTRLVNGPNGRPVAIPASVLGGRRSQDIQASTKSRARRITPPLGKTSPEDKRRKRLSQCQAHETVPEPAMVDDDDTFSVSTEIVDLLILLSDTEDDIKEPSVRTELKDKDPKASPKTDFEPGTLQEKSLPLLNPPSYATTPATKILQQHLQATLKVQQREPLHDLGWHVDPNLISTVYQWIVELHTFESSLPLAQDMKKVSMKSVVLELRFPPAFPMAPPFVRVIRPRFLEFTNGGGGHVTAGGAMCMELLTDSGWLPTASIESVLLQVRMAVTNTEPRPARLLVGNRQRDYSVGEAVEAYKRACITHGWNIPEDIQRLSWG